MISFLISLLLVFLFPLFSFQGAKTAYENRETIAKGATYANEHRETVAWGVPSCFGSPGVGPSMLLRKKSQKQRKEEKNFLSFLFRLSIFLSPFTSQGYSAVC